MAVNRVSQSPDNALVQRIAALERELRALKTPQPVGGDNLITKFSDIGTFEETIPANSSIHVPISFFASTKQLYIPALTLGFFLGSFDAAHAWPYGASVDPTKFTRAYHLDAGFSDPLGEGNLTYFVTMTNKTSTPLDVILKYALLYPAQGMTVV